jgi:hypothetical protein
MTLKISIQKKMTPLTKMTQKVMMKISEIMMYLMTSQMTTIQKIIVKT